MSRTTTYRGIAVVAGLILALLMITATSRAAWTDTTTNADSDIAAGSVDLTNDKLASAIISVTNAAPGDSWNGCVNVTYNGTVDGLTVDMSQIAVAAVDTEDQELADDLLMTITRHTSSDCSGAVEATLTTNESMGGYTTPSDPGYAANWTANTGDSRSYGFTISFPAGSNDDSQGGDVTFNFTWLATQ